MAASTGGPTSQRSMAGAVHRVSLGSTSPVTSHRHLEVVSSGSDDDAVRFCSIRLLATRRSGEDTQKGQSMSHSFAAGLAT